MADLKNWINLARAHWKEHLPRRFKELQKAGMLSKALKDAAEQTYREVSELEETGFQADEAWQMVRERYLILPAETDQRQEPPTSSLTHEMMKAVAAGQRTLEA